MTAVQIIVRRILTHPAKPSLLFLETFRDFNFEHHAGWGKDSKKGIQMKMRKKGNFNARAWHEPLSRHYGVSMLVWRGSVLPLLVRSSDFAAMAIQNTSYQLWVSPSYVPYHPTALGNAQLAHLLSHLVARTTATALTRSVPRGLGAFAVRAPLPLGGLNVPVCVLGPGEDGSNKLFHSFRRGEHWQWTGEGRGKWGWVSEHPGGDAIMFEVKTKVSEISVGFLASYDPRMGCAAAIARPLDSGLRRCRLSTITTWNASNREQAVIIDSR